jgi:hypothetical protein
LKLLHLDFELVLRPPIESTALSLTRPAVARAFSVLISRVEHTSSWAQELRLFLELLFICVTLAARPFAFINWVLPTSHLFDHQRP